MADTSTHIIRLANFPSVLPNLPPNYPLGPAPGKLQLLLNSNDNFLYHRFNPYTNHSDSIFGGLLSDKQPFVYTYIGDAKNSTFNKLPGAVKALAQVSNITPGTLNDVVRVSKFMISSWGAQFLLSQFAMQRLAPFDETRIYNPLSPILATVAPMTLGMMSPPTRHFSGLFGFSLPMSTVDSNVALADSNKGRGNNKGLIRGTGANNALVSLKSKWISNNASGGGLLSSIAGAFKSFFGSAPSQPSGTKFRADEQAADMMYNSKVLISDEKNGVRNGQPFISWYQPWYNDSNTGKVPTKFIKRRPIPQFIFNNTIYPLFQYQTMKDIESYTINDKNGFGHSVGYTPNDNGTSYKDVIFPSKEGEFTNSEILINYANYTNPDKKYITKLTDTLNEQVIKMNEQLSAVIKKINDSNKTYNVTEAVLSGLLPSPSSDGKHKIGYDALLDGNNINNLNINVGQSSTRQEYQYGSTGVSDGVVIPKTIDEIYKRVDGTSLRMATTFKSDGMNTLGIIKGKDSKGNKMVVPSDTDKNYKEWIEYRPYDDDLIAFFFYDVVNDKYIPFRATVKGIAESNTAFWDELRFIGRADQVYSYNGFSRTLSFTFNIVINSITELMPSWKKINYIASSVKPSNYTTGKNVNQKFNKFIVPPMFMLTIGDLYKFQPMVITSINVNIPEDASWETLNEINAKKGWSYLNGLITSPDLGKSKNYGQLPREAEISVTCNLLEKERAIVGGSHFGHAPRVDNFDDPSINGDDRYLSSKDPFLQPPTTIHKNFVEWNDMGKGK